MIDQEAMSVEATGASVTEAIAEGLEQLGLDRDDVDVEVLAEASRGIFGLGSRDAHVRLTLKPPPGDVAPAGELAAAAPQEIGPPIQAQEAPEEVRFPEKAELVPSGRVGAADVGPDLGELGEVARAALLELLSLMGVADAQVDVRRSEPADGDTYSPLKLDVTMRGDALIGPRGETLNALQYITRLIVGREQGGRVRLVLDVNGYKVRREQKVRQLAERLARQAVDTDRTVVLEPMPPFERRIVHLALRDDPEVTTQSVGEGDRRKVTIIPRYE